MILKIILILATFSTIIKPHSLARRRRKQHICDSSKRPKICEIIEKQCSDQNWTRKTCQKLRLDGEMNVALKRLTLRRLPDRLFWGYKNLTEIMITDTALDRLPTHLPRSLKNLQLFNNKIDYIPPGVFDKLHDLERVYLTGNELTDLSVWTFQHNVNLKYLHLSNNKLEKIPYGFFEGTYNLKSLDLSNNIMTELDLGLFNELVTLEVLNLSKNKLTWVWPEQFINLSELKEMYLNKNNISYLPEGSFDTCVNLERLNIADNFDEFGTEIKFSKDLVAVCDQKQKEYLRTRVGEGCSFDI